MIAKVASFMRRLRRAAPHVAEPAVPAPTLHDELASADISLDRWLALRLAGGCTYADVPPDRVRRLAEQFPEHAAHTIRAADRILAHEFDLLGSGPYRPVDPGRPERGGYVPIDWYLDPVQRLRFPERVPHREWNLLAMRPGLADVKLPWELARCQHWIPLGQAFRLTGDERYAREIADEHADFLEANPVGFGIHWTCTMDVALRALNWALSFELVRASAAAGSMRERADASLFDHGIFIERNLENTYEVTSNHFLSNIVGLFALSRVFRALPSGARWARACRDWLAREMQVQVLPDGADYESSIPYHRLVTELFLAGARIAQLDGEPMPPAYHASLRRMVEFLEAVLRPDGLLPQVGDADDGRVQQFSEYGTWRPQDARHLFAAAAGVLAEPRWLALGGSWGEWESAWWGGDVDRSAAPSPAAAPDSRLFEHAGVAVARDTRAYLLVTNGRVGTSGFGNHKHNDLLGFELHVDGTPLVVDPGSYVYTSNPDARNVFRSVRSHNTICVDHAEPNELKPEFLFRLFETATVEHLAFDDSPTFVEYRGAHGGYMRLPSPVRHERALRLMKGGGTLTIVDTLIGEAAHRCAWHFHFAPGVAVQQLGPDRFALAASGRRFRLRTPGSLDAVISDAWYSPSYGVRVPCRALDMTAMVTLSGASSFAFEIAPEDRAA